MNQKLLTLFAFNLLFATSSIAGLESRSPGKESSEEELEEFSTPLAARAAAKLESYPRPGSLSSFSEDRVSREPFLPPHPENGSFANLPSVMLELIASFIPDWRNFVRFAASCKACRDAALIAASNIQRFFRPTPMEQLALLQGADTLRVLRIEITDITQMDSISELLIKHASILHTLALLFPDEEIDLDDLRKITDALNKATNLKVLHLHLNGNYIDTHGMFSLTESLDQMKNLVSLHLDLSHNSIHSSATKDLARALSQMKNLESLTLDLSYNMLTWTEEIEDPDFQILAAALGQMKNLKSLNLNVIYSLGPSQFQALRKALKHIPKLHISTDRLMPH